MFYYTVSKRRIVYLKLEINWYAALQKHKYHCQCDATICYCSSTCAKPCRDNSRPFYAFSTTKRESGGLMTARLMVLNQQCLELWYATSLFSDVFRECWEQSAQDSFSAKLQGQHHDPGVTASKALHCLNKCRCRKMQTMQILCTSLNLVSCTFLFAYS